MDKAAAIADQFTPKAEDSQAQKADSPETEIRWDTPATPKSKRSRKPLKKKNEKAAQDQKDQKEQKPQPAQEPADRRAISDPVYFLDCLLCSYFTAFLLLFLPAGEWAV